MASIADYLFNVLIALDRLITALVRGNPNETLSSYAYRMDRDGKPWGFTRKIIDLIFFFQKSHCYQAYIFDRNRILPK